MSKNCFTEQQIQMLLENPYVKAVSTKSITFTDEFKALFLTQYRQGKNGKRIFQDHGLDPAFIGHNRIKHYYSRWTEFEGRAEGHIDQRSALVRGKQKHVYKKGQGLAS